MEWLETAIDQALEGGMSTEEVLSDLELKVMALQEQLEADSDD